MSFITYHVDRLTKGNRYRHVPIYHCKSLPMTFHKRILFCLFVTTIEWRYYFVLKSIPITCHRRDERNLPVVRLVWWSPHLSASRSLRKASQQNALWVDQRLNALDDSRASNRVKSFQIFPGISAQGHSLACHTVFAADQFDSLGSNQKSHLAPKP